MSSNSLVFECALGAGLYKTTKGGMLRRSRPPLYYVVDYNDPHHPPPWSLKAHNAWFGKGSADIPFRTRLDAYTEPKALALQARIVSEIQHLDGLDGNDPIEYIEPVLPGSSGSAASSGSALVCQHLRLQVERLTPYRAWIERADDLPRTCEHVAEWKLLVEEGIPPRDEGTSPTQEGIPPRHEDKSPRNEGKSHEGLILDEESRIQGALTTALFPVLPPTRKWEVLPYQQLIIDPPRTWNSFIMTFSFKGIRAYEPLKHTLVRVTSDAWTVPRGEYRWASNKDGPWAILEPDGWLTVTLKELNEYCTPAGVQMFEDVHTLGIERLALAIVILPVAPDFVLPALERIATTIRYIQFV